MKFDDIKKSAHTTSRLAYWAPRPAPKRAAPSSAEGMSSFLGTLAWLRQSNRARSIGMRPGTQWKLRPGEAAS